MQSIAQDFACFYALINYRQRNLYWQKTIGIENHKYRINYIDSWYMKVEKGGTSAFLGIQPCLDGLFLKWVTNSGALENVPDAAFILSEMGPAIAHLRFAFSKRKLLVTDIQGVSTSLRTHK